MTRLPDTETVQHRFPMGNTTLHVRTIPGCVAVGMKEYASAETGVGAWYDLALPVCCTRDGLPSRGAALILADQAGAVGTYATLDTSGPMMTLDLRVDWHGPLPRANRLDVRVENVVRQGKLSLVRGRILADETLLVGSLHATFLVGAFPGGRRAEWQDEVLEATTSKAASFDDALRMEPDGEGWLIAPGTEMIGARPIPAYHGGFVAGALEQAAWLLAGQRNPVNFEIRYLLPTRADLPLRVRTRILRSGRQASIIEADAVQGDAQTVVASARATYLSEPNDGQDIYEFPA
ncbi:MAG: thioesterase family protein [Sphingomonadales bacterium]|nr:thioesterase family protein [Sphingomonadales bacterium]